METRVRRCFVQTFVLLTLAGAATAVPQGSKADYERANALRDRFMKASGAQRAQVEWIESSDHLLFVRDDRRPKREQWRIVDPERGSDEPLLDERLEAALAAVGEDTSNGLRVARAYATNEFFVLAGGVPHRWLRATGELARWTARSGSQSLSWDLGPSRDGPACRITFLNERDRPVRLFWIDRTGKRAPYGEVAPGARFSQNTYEGHNWLIVDSDGLELGAHRAQPDDEHGLILIPVVVPPRPADPPKSRRTPGRSPDERWTASVRDRELFLVDEHGAERRVASCDDPQESWRGPIQWSPDSTRFVAWKRREGGDRVVNYVESSPIDQLQPVLHSYPYLKPGDEIPQSFPHLFVAATGEELEISHALFANPWAIDRLEWESDSSSFSFLYNQRGHQVLRVVSIDAASGAARAIVDETCATFFDYPNKTFLHRVANSNDLLWMSERSGWNHIYRIDRTTGEVRNAVTSGEWLVRSVVSTNDDTRELELVVRGFDADQDPYHDHYVRVGYDGTGFTLLTRADGTHVLTYSPDRAYYIDRWSRVDHPPTYELRRTSDGERIADVMQVDTAPLEAVGWRAPQRFVAKGRDGATDIWGVVFRPTNFDPQRKYAVVEQIYAGPHSAFVPKSFEAFHGHPQELAELGFIVVQIDGMGTNWRSKAFHDVAWGNLADAGFPDRIAWLQALAAAHPEVDLSRVGIYGGSAGGQSAMRALIDHSDFYRVAVADCGCHDNRMDKVWWNELWMGWPVGLGYRDSSNVEHADRMNGDLLLIVGETDENVDPASTMQVVHALIEADKDFDLLVMPGVGHGAGGTPYGWRRTCDFLVRKLYNVEPRAP